MPNMKPQAGSAQPPKVAIVHDWLYGGGAELVVEQLHSMYPDAPIYTSFCTKEWRERLNGKVITGYLNYWPLTKLHRFLPVFRQHWFRRLNLSDYDIVISSSGNGEARFVLPKKGNKKHRSSDKNIKSATHISYCHSPTHFYWRKYEEYAKNPSFRPKWLARFGLKILIKPLRKRDYQAAQYVDYFIANSSHIQKDIKQYYNRDSTVVHPPVDTKKFGKSIAASRKQQTENNETGERRSSNIKYQTSNVDAPRPYIMWGRHVPYKRFDLAIQACNKLKAPLIIIGKGPETEALKKIAGPTVTFTGRISDEELIAYAHSAQAFLFPGEEDFGISPVEAMAAGLPVIAYKSGGALDYVTDGKTGTFFNEQTVDALASCLQSFSAANYDQKSLILQAEQFSEATFKKNFVAFVDKYTK